MAASHSTTTTSRPPPRDAAQDVIAAPPAVGVTGEREQPAASSTTPLRSRLRPHRTVLDFDTQEDLLMALLNMNIQSRDDCCRRDDGDSSSAAACVTASTSMLSSSSSSGSHDDHDRERDDGGRDGGGREGHDDDDDDRMQDDQQLDDTWDWTLASGTYDVSNSFPRPSVQQEVQRLQNVKSFASAMMDAGDSRPKDNTRCPKDLLDRLSKMAQRWLDVPICTINLMDLGRAYILSGQGVGDIYESARKETWCSHTLQYHGPMMQVPDATKDWRFCQSPHVTGPFHLRFYASAPMVSPEGFRIGTFCIMGCQERPGGLSAAEQETLLDLSRMACQILVERRELVRQRQLIRSTANDLLQGPMAGLSHCLRALSSKAASSPTRLHSPRLLATATHCNKLAQDICHNSLETTKTITAAATATTSISPLEYDPNQNNRSKVQVLSSSLSSPLPSLSATQLNKVLQIKDGLLPRLQAMMDVFPKPVPMVMSVVDPHVPSRIVADEVLLVRTCLAMLAEACSSSCASTTSNNNNNNNAPIQFQIRLLQRRSSDTHIVFECHHQAAASVYAASLEERIFGHLALNSQQTGGPEGHCYGCHCTTTTTTTSCAMWFSIPLIQPPQSSLPLNESSPTITIPDATQHYHRAAEETRNPDTPVDVRTAIPTTPQANHNLLLVSDSIGMMPRQPPQPQQLSPPPPLQPRGTIRSREDDSMELMERSETKQPQQLLQQQGSSSSSSDAADSFRSPKRIKVLSSSSSSPPTSSKRLQD